MASGNSIIRRRLAPGEVWRRPVRSSPAADRLFDLLGTIVAVVLLPASLLVMLATLCALPLLYAVPSRKERQ